MICKGTEIDKSCVGDNYIVFYALSMLNCRKIALSITTHVVQTGQMLFVTVKPQLTSSVFGYVQVIFILKQSDYHWFRPFRRHVCIIFCILTKMCSSTL